MSADQQRRAGRPPSGRVDRAVVDAAVDLLADVGLGAFTVAEVARRAGSTTPAVYRRYADKTALVVAAVEHEVAAVAQAAASVPQSTDLRGELVRWATMMSRALTPKRVRILAALTFGRSESPEPARRLSEALRELGEFEWRGIVERAVERGELAAPEHPAVLGVIPSALLTSAALFGDEPSGVELIDSIADDILLPLLQPAVTSRASKTED